MSEPELRSVEMLQSVVNGIPSMEIIILTNECIKVRVKGESQRWYQVESEFQEIGPSESEWILAVTAGRWKQDVITSNQYSVNLCLHPKNQRLPIGDRVVSMVLALFNDIQTGLEIPLLAQFLICQREMLKNIVIFQETMIVTNDMMGEDDWPDEDTYEEEEDEEEREMYHAFERGEIAVSTDEMSDLQQAWEEEIHDLIGTQIGEVEIDVEKKQKEEQDLIDFWDLMTDKLHDQ